MSHPMIKVQDLSRQYKIGVDRTYKTFQDGEPILKWHEEDLSIYKR